MQIYFVYDQVHQLGAVRTRSEFSEKWLGRERSYLTVLKAKRRKPSCVVWATCAVSLLRAADAAANDNAAPRTDAGMMFRSLANRCLDELLTEGLRNREVGHDHQHH
ncbi:MAG: hypothetical protein IOC80_03275 [Rhodobacter sp.]|jgi:hypothetical protein|nr:hypothetical protein [Rhodobacter sp.]MCA3774089.1 hypothetical protein [Cutibacterium sp.]MCA3518885.1 hypothetical protein [Rhodobacter sp.]MCA3527577.1 hypothetical protein [Rhodobacter sp.]MCA3530490.1 hypothetical protein [Rhodobacter sp.]